MTLDEAIKDMKTNIEWLKGNKRLLLLKQDCKTIADAEQLIEEMETVAEWLNDYKRLLKQKPCDDRNTTAEAEQFAKWVANEIFDENWEYNMGAFAELACRKLTKLGIVRAKGDEWELIGPQESEIIRF